MSANPYPETSFAHSIYESSEEHERAGMPMEFVTAEREVLDAITRLFPDQLLAPSCDELTDEELVHPVLVSGVGGMVNFLTGVFNAGIKLEPARWSAYRKFLEQRRAELFMKEFSGVFH